VGFRQSPLEGLDVIIDPQFWTGKRVFLTGHTGFKGSWLSLWLLRMQAQLTGYSLDPPTNPSLFERARVADGMTSHIGDIADLPGLSAAVAQAKPDILFHMAAQPLVRKSYADPVETYRTNVMGTLNVLEAVRAAGGVRAVIIVTTDKCYENKEWHWGYRENDHLGGYDPYSSSKACAEILTAAYRQSYFHPSRYAQHKTAIASGRAGNVIGGGDWALDRLIPDSIAAYLKKEDVIIRNPHATRPWQHVLEPLSGYLCLAERLYADPSFAKAWNFGPHDSDVVPVAEVVQSLFARLGRPGGVRVQTAADQPHEAAILKLDCSLARAELGWTPAWNLELTLERIAAWVKVQEKDGDVRGITIEQIDEYARLRS
jgi:CDP-glucose 4,6-dehydratase